MESENKSNHQIFNAPLEYIHSSETEQNQNWSFIKTTESFSSMLEPNYGPQPLHSTANYQNSITAEKFSTSLIEDHIWLIGILTGVILVLVLLSCSLRSSYFQENYFITRAKEWVHIPLLHQPVPSPETGVNDDTGSQHKLHVVEHADRYTCISETTIMKSTSDDAELCNQRKLERDVSEMCLTETESTVRHPSLSKTNKDHFVFNSDIFLTKSESLDEAHGRLEIREKCFKSNKSVDEILNRPEPSGISLSEQKQVQSTSSICTPKCRKLQERRGSNHSLTIAVKPAETTVLPTVTTPRECSAAQFLLTAGNCMSRRQLRSCLKDVKNLHAEFWSIPTNAPELVEQVAGCAIKNRYRYVLPNPHSRVKLPSSDPSDPTSGYINGNYIRAQSGDARAYIATQGPLTNTINDFWLMVWSERAPAIVMITKLVESGKAKCEPYLPAESTCRYGDITVTIDSIEDSVGCDVRHLSLKHGDEEEVHRATHYWYSDWPDHKTPDNPRSLVDLAVTIESLRRGQSSLSTTLSSQPNIGPIVVHCSAGVGRTGCFIALCQGLNQLVAEGKVDILGIVCALRCDRGGMVQTAEQYEFIHRGLCLFERSTLTDYAGD